MLGFCHLIDSLFQAVIQYILVIVMGATAGIIVVNGNNGLADEGDGTLVEHFHDFVLGKSRVIAVCCICLILGIERANGVRIDTRQDIQTAGIGI